MKVYSLVSLKSNTSLQYTFLRPLYLFLEFDCNFDKVIYLNIGSRFIILSFLKLDPIFYFNNSSISEYDILTVVEASTALLPSTSKCTNWHLCPYGQY